MAQDRLLEELGRRRGCFLSALGDSFHREQTIKVLLQVDPRLYTPEEWSYCLSYILDRKIVIHGWQEVARLLEKEQKC